jgi:hypothetical protein
MPELKNFTPFPNFRYYSGDNTGKDFGVVIVKGTYTFSPSWRLLLAEEQAPMVFTDLCYGALNVTSLRHPSDLVPNKPSTDVIVNAIARSPDGKAVESWICGLRIEERDGSSIIDKELRITGPRQWMPRWKRSLSDREKQDWREHRRYFIGWELSAPAPIAELPLHYEYAYGGSKPIGRRENGDALLDFDPRNPLGRGAIDPQWSDHTIPQPAPQIEAVGEPIRDPYAAYTPESFGPIPPAWEPRLPLAGAYDEKWREEIWPDWPPDYKFAFHHSAHPDLICPRYLRGNERIKLSNLIAGHEDVQIELPGDRIVLDLVKADGEIDQREMSLDTVFLDIASDKRRRRHVFLSWRLNFEPNLYNGVRIALHRAVSMSPSASGRVSRTSDQERPAI